MTRLKITGITRVEDALLAAELGFQVVSCVFYARSPRYVNSRRVWQIRNVLPPTIRVVGVFVDTPTPLVKRVIEQCQLDGAQLFGAEDREAVDALHPWTIKAVSVDSPAGIRAATGTFIDRRARRADDPRLLLHLKDDVAERWDLAAEVADRAPIILASDSLTADRLPHALDRCRPWALDVWDAVESEPGVLDESKIRRWVRAAREAGATTGVAPTIGSTS